MFLKGIKLQRGEAGRLAWNERVEGADDPWRERVDGLSSATSPIPFQKRKDEKQELMTQKKPKGSETK
ncbi:hypothetical protein CEXT_691821 [Caerostris extrusa]|uniref:Uncharacterized protein n=1 Tax=Caerostris extrusa TaxID=172846 RepID=A0AAV4VHI9_CAEEX|nr:hypothetical protein CEXT_691821 [Caerostris extrusa]